jgi:hypothetical protein
MSALPDSDDLIYRLDEQTFEAWWKSEVDPADRDDYVHLHQGHKEGARFVCALDLLQRGGRNRRTDDMVVRAYLLSVGAPESDLRSPVVRIEANGIYTDDAVEFLMERVRYRHVFTGADRVVKQTLAKIQEWYTRVEGDDHGMEYKQVLDTERAAVDAGVKLLGITERTIGAAQARRDKESVKNAKRANAAKLGAGDKPPTVEESSEFIKMLVTEHGAEVVKSLIDKAITPVLSSAPEPPHAS